MPNPRIEPIEIGNLTLVDRSDADFEQSRWSVIGFNRGL
ncbi:unnamed protein product, partial [marine sediment metagenome]